MSGEEPVTDDLPEMVTPAVAGLPHPRNNGQQSRSGDDPDHGRKGCSDHATTYSPTRCSLIEHAVFGLAMRPGTKPDRNDHGDYSSDGERNENVAVVIEVPE
jgi:hypothetical protein